MVMHRVLHLLSGSTSGRRILSRVAAAVLIADGDQVSFDREVMDGSAWHIAFGIGQVDRGLSGSSREKFSEGFRSRAIRVCQRGDLVCDFGTAIGEDLLHASLGDLNRHDYLKGIAIHTSYTDSKPLVQAAGQAARDAKALNYYGGKLVVKGKVGQPISASTVVIGGKLPLTVSATIDGGEPPWLALGAAGDNTVTLGGTPSAAGSWTFDISVQDAADSHVLIPVSLTVT